MPLKTLMNKKRKRQPFDFLNLIKIREEFGIIYQNIALVGLCCLVLMYKGYDEILIPVKDLAIIIICFDIIITLLFIRFYKQHMGLIWSWIHNLSYGFIAAFMFILTNDILSNRPSVQETTPIEKVYLTKTGRRMREITVVVIKVEKRHLNFRYNSKKFKEAIRAKEALVTIKEGFWGYPVLTGIELIVPFTD